MLSEEPYKTQQPLVQPYQLLLIPPVPEELQSILDKVKQPLYDDIQKLRKRYRQLSGGTLHKVIGPCRL